ncbi:MAG: PilW family protein [Burkholderiales bacterium]|nr:PilW family protein [Burkholderiales bacterium]
MHAMLGRSRSFAAGFTLIELMIGMALGLLSVLIITQVMSLFEAQRRSTTGSADAQTNGGIALHSIARDVQLAGYGLLPHTDSALECSTATFGGMGITGIAPIGITEVAAVAGVSAASDRITIRYASSQMAGAVSQITAMVGAAATVASNLGCQVGDVTLATSAGNCAMSTASAVSAAGVSPISITPANGAIVGPGANIACLGSWIEVTYAVNPATGDLDRTVRVDGVSDGSTVKGVVTGTTPSVVGVVNLQAQYGVSASANSNQVTQWVNPSGGTWAAPTVANRNRIKAIRLAVIARNPKAELSAVTAACSSITAAPATGLCAWEGSSASPAPAVDLSPADANWDRYRYRVFETIIPLRNVIWAKDTL